MNTGGKELAGGFWAIEIEDSVLYHDQSVKTPRKGRFRFVFPCWGIEAI